MSVVDLHPEHLLDREIRGELDDADRRLLEEHLAHCATCRMERRMRADFGLELEKSELSPDVAGIVESLGRRSSPAIETGRRDIEPSPVSQRQGWRTRRLVLLVAAAMLTVGTVAFASSEAGQREIATIFGHGQTATTNVDAPPSGAGLAARSPGLPSAVRTAEPSPTGDLPPPAVTVEPVVAATAAAPAAPVAAVEPVESPAKETPARLFEEERQARARGDGAGVLRLHAQLVARYPASREAQVSRMVVARMLLDTGDAAGALDGFDAYLRAGSGALVEDALAGRAEALDRLGREAEARGAWVALLDRYPGTAYAAHARARIASREN